MNRVLLIEDDYEISRIVELELKHANYSVEIAGDGQSGLDMALDDEFDIIILDLMLPVLNGFDLLQQLRVKKHTPVIILSASNDINSKIAGLDNGAVDYVTKPFSIDELIARVRAHLRPNKQIESQYSVLKIGHLVLDINARIAKYKDNLLRLSKIEFDMLVYLIQNKNHIASREQIYQIVWGTEFLGANNNIDVYINYLRTKIDKKYGINLIESVRGCGYVIRELEEPNKVNKKSNK